ncbi:transposase [Streptomyces mirabilis]|uniref:transposase n=1 Tax=Streptomyces mirabilis TaxID=68239 RepID=UPI00368275F3
MRLAWLLSDLPVELVGRLCSDRLLRLPKPPRVYDPKGGRPPKHGPELRLAKPETWRTRGPLFLTDRKAPGGTPTRDVCPETGRARLSYRRAEEIFGENTRLLTNPLVSPEDFEDLLAPAPAQRADSRRRGQHLQPDASGPLPPCFRPFPGAVRTTRCCRGRPARCRARPGCTPTRVSGRRSAAGTKGCQWWRADGGA